MYKRQQFIALLLLGLSSLVLASGGVKITLVEEDDSGWIPTRRIRRYYRDNYGNLWRVARPQTSWSYWCTFMFVTFMLIICVLFCTAAATSDKPRRRGRRGILILPLPGSPKARRSPALSRAGSLDSNVHDEYGNHSPPKPCTGIARPRRMTQIHQDEHERRTSHQPLGQQYCPYFESQEADYCALHSANCVLYTVGRVDCQNLLQPDDMNRIAGRNNRAEGNQNYFDQNESVNGFWSQLTLQEALRQNDLSMDNMSPNDFQQMEARFPWFDGAFIINTPNHWYAFIPSTDDSGIRYWWNVDSLQHDPTCVGRDDAMMTELRRLNDLKELRTSWRQNKRQYEEITGVMSRYENPEIPGHTSSFVEEILPVFHDAGVVQRDSVQWVGDQITQIFKVKIVGAEW